MSYLDRIQKIGHTPESVAKMLGFVDSKDRDLWVKCGQAVHSELGNDGFEVFDNWSATASNYDAKAVKTTWRSFKTGCGVTIASLIYEAKKGGYVANSSANPTPILSADEIARRKAERAEQEKAAELSKANSESNAAAKCKEILHQLKTAKDGDNWVETTYTKNKKIKPYQGFIGDGDAIIVPIYETLNNDSLINLQTIQANGEKRFYPKARAKGGFVLIGSIEPDAAVLVCEGYATACSLHEATGLAVVVSFNAVNLSPVVEALRETLPHQLFVLCADNDAHKPEVGNTGIKKAAQVCTTFDCLIVAPEFADIGTQPTDFNDLHQLEGLDKVNALVCDAIARNQKPTAEYLAGFGVADVVDADVVDADFALDEPESDEAMIKRLAGMDGLNFARAKKAAAEQLGISITDLNKLVKAEQENTKGKGTQGANTLFEDIEPCSHPVNGAAMLDDVLSLLQQHVIADAETLHAAALWVCLTWLVDYATVLPLAVITAPEKGCGKTVLLSTMAMMANKPLQASNTSAAAMFRVIEAHAPTLFIDETDTFMRDNEDLRGIINSGHTRSSAYVLRTVGDDFEVKRFSTWSAKALSGIGHLPETIESRAIILKMRRKIAGETTRNLRHTPPAVFDEVKQKLARWSDDNGTRFASMRPIMAGLNNRDADNFEPLLSIAQLAGGQWVERITAAALVLCASESDNRSIGIELLDACRTVFESWGGDKIKSTDLLDEICKDDELPFATYNRGKPMTARQLSNRLKEFGIHSKNNRFTGGIKKGYVKQDFEKAFLVYLQNDGGSDTSFFCDSTVFAATTLQNDANPVNSRAGDVASKLHVAHPCRYTLQNDDTHPENVADRKSVPLHATISLHANAVNTGLEPICSVVAYKNGNSEKNLPDDLKEWAASLIDGEIPPIGFYSKNEKGGDEWVL
jgi:putative DNA primase/helicase